jgi:hypothetical protein
LSLREEVEEIRTRGTQVWPRVSALSSRCAKITYQEYRYLGHSRARFCGATVWTDCQWAFIRYPPSRSSGYSQRPFEIRRAGA